MLIAAGSGVIAYTVPGLSAMAYCSIFWNLPAMPSGCYTQTRGSTAVHEVTVRTFFLFPIVHSARTGLTMDLRYRVFWQGNRLTDEPQHLSQIAGTSDYGGYGKTLAEDGHGLHASGLLGYNFVRSLSAAQNLNHADTYTLFAQSIYAGC